jgi:hypothetical protein
MLTPPGSRKSHRAFITPGCTGSWACCGKREGGREGGRERATLRQKESTKEQEHKKLRKGNKIKRREGLIYSHTCGRPPVAMFDTTQAASFRTSHSAVAIWVITIETKPFVMVRACTCSSFPAATLLLKRRRREGGRERAWDVSEDHRDLSFCHGQGVHLLLVPRGDVAVEEKKEGGREGEQR